MRLTEEREKEIRECIQRKRDGFVPFGFKVEVVEDLLNEVVELRRDKAYLEMMIGYEIEGE